MEVGDGQMRASRRSAFTALLWGILALALGWVMVDFLLEHLHPPLIRTILPPNPTRHDHPPISKRPAPPFQLTDQYGQPFDSARLKGKVWVADFIFTSCAGVCPQMSEKMSQLQQQLKSDVVLISFSVDPNRDTPDVLLRYSQRYRAQPGRWFFLTGPQSTLTHLIQTGFGLSVSEGTDEDEPITHSVRFVLVDRQGMIHGYYDSTDPTALKQLVRQANTL
jgi:protein SCO1/2